MQSLYQVVVREAENGDSQTSYSLPFNRSPDKQSINKSSYFQMNGPHIQAGGT